MRTRRILLSLLLMVGMVLGFMPMTVTAADADAGQNEPWTTYAADKFAGGRGTKDDPYQIATAEQLAKLAKEVNSGVVGENHHREYFKMVNDIDLSGHRWVPIGYGDTEAKPFNGYFDGAGYKVTGLYVDEWGNNVYAGLFGVVTANTDEMILQNITIEDAKVYAGYSTDEKTAHYGAGVLVGNLTTSGGSLLVTHAAIENCHVTGAVASYMYAGGLIGDLSYGVVTDCTADVTVSGVVCAGGFVGFSYTSKFESNIARGNVDSGGWSTGGFVGNDYNSVFKSCTAYGNVRAKDWNLGGFGGYLEGAEIDNCVAYGDVASTATGFDPKTGGFAGTNRIGEDSKGNAIGGIIRNSHAFGTVIVNNTGSVGGFVASFVDGTIEGCSFDKTKNPTLEGSGWTGISDKSDITGKDTEEVLADICTDIYGGHEFDPEWIVDRPATCQEEGSISHHCIRCNYKTDVTVTDKINHADIELVKVESKKATHLAEGVNGYWTCPDCGKYFADQAGAKEITLADTVIPKLTEHVADGTGLHSDETGHFMVCICGEIMDKTAHTEQTTITQKATTKKDGKSVTKCTVCEKTLATAKIAKVSKITISKKSYTYNGKAKKPSVTVKDSNGKKLKKGTDYNISYAKGRKKVGTYTVKITLKGSKYSGSKTCTFKIIPKSTKLTSKKGQKKAIVIGWKKQTKQTSGYQLQYATKKSFSNAKTVTIKKNSITEKTIKKLASGKKYYVRIRTYKNVKVNGKTKKIASAWSKTVTVKTK